MASELVPEEIELIPLSEEAIEFLNPHRRMTGQSLLTKMRDMEPGQILNLKTGEIANERSSQG